MTTAEEWADAACLDLTLFETREGPATVSSRWWIKNDAQWVYLLARVPIAELEVEGAFIDYFWPLPLVDEWEHSDGGHVRQDGSVNDLCNWDGEWHYDVQASPPGSNNVEDKPGRDATYYWFEFRKALNSGDDYDWSWAAGDTVGDEGDLIIGVWESGSLGFWIGILLHLCA